jgi:pimeloyl-ACP methyl ester carboxylesterase
MWRPQLEALADELTVVAWDEPGAGRSSDVPGRFALPDYADCLAALIEALDLGPAHVGGLSWGGTVVLELFRRRPELVATLLLFDTYAGWKGSLPEEEMRARVEGLRRMLAVEDHLFDPTLPGLFAGDPPAEVVALMKAMAADVRPESMKTALLVMAEADLRDMLPRIAVPTLLIWGELDAVATRRRPPARARDPGCGARGDPGRRPREQPRAARAVQRRGPGVLPRSLAASGLAAASRRQASMARTAGAWWSDGYAA